MSDERFDCIIVGAGPAGSVAGYILAKAGLEVLIIERGDTAGCKNVTGGRLYGHSLESIIPAFKTEAPLERKVTKEMISMLTKDSAITLDFHSQLMRRGSQESYTVLRAEFDQWLAEKAEEAGATIVPGIRVDDLLWEGDQVVGVIAGEDTMEANVVIAADGANSLLAQKAKLKRELKPSEVAVGVKEIIELPAHVIEDRFNINSDEGAARLFAGECTKGKIGGGFLYTNKNTVSLGLVFNVQNLIGSEYRVPDMLEDFKKHPSIKPLLAGGKLAEYSAHLVPEAGINMLPALYTNGMLVVGDAAGLVINIGYMVRGMDLAIASGAAAAKAVTAAAEKGDYSKNTLTQYQKFLEESFVLKDLKAYQNFPHFMENSRIFNDYPKLAENILADMFTVNGQPARPLRNRMIGHVKQVGITNLLRDGWKGVRSL